MSTMHKEECQQVHPFSNKKKAMFLQQWKVRIFPGTHQGSSLSRCVRLSLQSEPGHHHIQQENQSLPENLHATNNMDFKHVISQPPRLNQSHFALLWDEHNHRFALFTDELDAQFALFTDEHSPSHSRHSSLRIFRKRFSFCKTHSKPIALLFCQHGHNSR